MLGLRTGLYSGLGKPGHDGRRRIRCFTLERQARQWASRILIGLRPGSAADMEEQKAFHRILN